MHRYIALLRGINVGGHLKIKMVDLKALFESLGFRDVVTYIQSGNVVFSSEKETSSQVISEAIKNTYGWDVPVLVRTASDIEKILINCPFSEEKMQRSYFMLFQEEPSKDNMEIIKALDFPGEEFYVTPACLYFFCETGYARVKMNGTFIERKLKVHATSRNYNTMAKLIQLSTN